jgi:hypothetical protein
MWLFSDIFAQGALQIENGKKHKNDEQKEENWNSLRRNIAFSKKEKDVDSCGKLFNLIAKNLTT